MLAHHVRDHLPDRAGFAALARGIFRIEPVETGLRVVRGLLLRHEQGKTVALGKRRPAGAHIVAGRTLSASVQHDDKRVRLLKMAGDEREHPEIARIGAKAGGLSQRAADPWLQVFSKIRKAIESM